MKSSSKIIISLLLVYLSIPQVFGQINDIQHVLTNYKDIVKQSGKTVTVFGEIVRHYKLEKEPFVLLLPNNKWIFLGNYNFIKKNKLDSYKILITGVLDSVQKDFSYVNYECVNKIPDGFNYHQTLSNSEDIIANHPYFSKILKIEPVYECNSLHEVEAKKGKWVYLYGHFQKSDKSLSFYRAQKKAILKLKSPIIHNELPKKGLGYFIVKFDSLKKELAPVVCAVQYNLPICTNPSDLQQYYGDLVAIKVRRSYKRFPLGTIYTFFKGARTEFFPYNGGVPHVRRKIWVIDRVSKVFGEKPFYMPQNSSAVGNFIWWKPSWLETH